MTAKTEAYVHTSALIAFADRCQGATAERRRRGGWPGGVLAAFRNAGVDACEPAGADAGAPFESVTLLIHER